MIKIGLGLRLTQKNTFEKLFLLILNRAFKVLAITLLNIKKFLFSFHFLFQRQDVTGMYFR